AAILRASVVFPGARGTDYHDPHQATPLVTPARAYRDHRPLAVLVSDPDDWRAVRTDLVRPSLCRAGFPRFHGYRLGSRVIALPEEEAARLHPCRFIHAHLSSGGVLSSSRATTSLRCSHAGVWRATGWEIVQHFLAQQPGRIRG